MAEAIGAVSGGVALATCALNASMALFTAIQSYQKHPDRVRDLLHELEELNGVLQMLTELSDDAADLDFSAIRAPLDRCRKACSDFEQEIERCRSRSGADKTSFRDWARLRYMGDNIDYFRRMLAGYKSTFAVALAAVNIRKNKITTDRVEQCKELIETTTDDLEAHLASINEKLETIFGCTVPESASEASELAFLKQERASTQTGLDICAQLTEYINKITITRSKSSSQSSSSDAYPERLVCEGLEDCTDKLRLTTQKLEKHMREIMNRLVARTGTAMASKDDVADLARLQEEWDTARQSLDICSRADQQLHRSFSTIDNYATGDAIQFLVSTNDKTIKGRNRGLGPVTRQVGGHISDASIKEITRYLESTVNPGTTRDKGAAPLSGTAVTGEPAGDSTVSGAEFSDRYGEGFSLRAEHAAVSAAPS